MTRPAHKQRQGVAVAISVAVHVVIFVGLIFAIPRLAPPSTPAAIEVQIIRPAPPKERSAAASSTAARAPRHEPAQRTESAAEPAPPSPAGANSSADKPADQPGRDAAIIAALRASVGCRHSGLVRLSPDEQRACDRIARADRAGIGAAHFGIEPEKQAAFDTAAKRDSILQQPFLSAKPTKGCKPRVTESDAQTGGGKAEQDWTTSVACAIPF